MEGRIKREIFRKTKKNFVKIILETISITLLSVSFVLVFLYSPTLIKYCLISLLVIPCTFLFIKDMWRSARIKAEKEVIKNA